MRMIVPKIRKMLICNEFTILCRYLQTTRYKELQTALGEDENVKSFLKVSHHQYDNFFRLVFCSCLLGLILYSDMNRIGFEPKYFQSFCSKCASLN